ncbi:MAG: valine--tRNA ligase [Actinomycetota bacterium]|nr:valine--tRNA ligase [Actinomycetota bacterium]
MTSTRPAPPPAAPAREFRVPERPGLEGIEAKWATRWEEDGTYRFDRTRPRAEVYSIDTPPPTVSGSLHIGHVFSYTHADVVARFQRMTGKELFYPIGWDDNGLPTERRVQNYYGVRCDPTVGYDTGFRRPDKPDPKRPVSISRGNFIELCEELTMEDEKVFEELWRRVGLSVDWSLLYTTISDDSRSAAQRAFLRNLARGEAYLADAPTMWDVSFQTAVSQAELEARNYPGHYHRVAFHGPAGSIHVETTRPELIVSCVALVTHPDDERHRELVGSTVRSPLFGVELPVVAHPAAEPDKGSGVAMCCTFGDLVDVQWWRELDLPVRTVIGRDGRLQREPPDWLTSSDARDAYQELAGKSVFGAREAVVSLLRTGGDLEGEPTPTQRMTNFYEKGDKPLEIVSTRQWYITNGGRDPGLRAALVRRGDEVDWTPPFMQHRFTNWTEGLNGDWLISRQRYFGVPIPVWYPLDGRGEPNYERPIVPAEHELPVDPAAQAPAGYDESQRGTPNGFAPDPDIMDTWATSSLTPHIAGGWERDADLFERVFPMDLCTHAHDIIRTWLFSSVLRADLEHHTLPWAHTSINGWILDPDRKKMAKSKGNIVEPFELQEQCGADGLRYWACAAAPGTDTAVDLGQMKVGRRLANKLLNASRFVLGRAGTASGDPTPDSVTAALDRALLAGLAEVVESATAAFDGYQYHRALEVAEKFFWGFCDDYLELVKGRAYGEGQDAESARATLRLALDTFLRLFAPFLPFVTEEVWSWWREGSVHRSAWPSAAPLMAADGDPTLLSTASAVLAEVRKAKSTQQVSLRAEVSRVVVTGDPSRLAAVEAIRADLLVAGVIAELVLTESAEELVTVELAVLV